MIELPNWVDLLEHFERSAVTARPELCLRRRHKEAECRCRGACPAEAITEGDPVALDEERCIGCGLCLHLCPTGVFRGEVIVVDRLLDVLAATDGRAELACPRKPHLDRARAEVGYVVEVKPCLAALAPSTLLMMAARGVGVVWLNDEPCAECPIGAVHPHIERVADEANRWLAVFGREPVFFTYRGAAERLRRKARRRYVMKGDQPRYSRRDFFSSFRREAQRAVTSILSETLAARMPEAVTIEGRLAPHLPPERVALAEALTRLGAPAVATVSTAGLPLAAVQVSAACTACGHCALKFCPTGALTFALDESHFALNFTALKCVDCGLCALGCPSGAITFGAELPVGELWPVTPHPVRAGALTACSNPGCGELCADEGDEPLCFLCRQKRDLLARTRGEPFA